MVTGPDGAPSTLHRTYLTADGRKAEVEKPRLLMPGPFPKGGAIKLAAHGEVLGIAEGIETAFAASALFGMPCWAAVCDTALAAWLPPEDVVQVIIFADNDQNFAGQAAAYRLAHRLAVKDRVVRVESPSTSGWDWNDVLWQEWGAPRSTLSARQPGRGRNQRSTLSRPNATGRQQALQALTNNPALQTSAAVSEGLAATLRRVLAEGEQATDKMLSAPPQSNDVQA